VHRQHAAHHTIDPDSGKHVSFGLIRMAHIDPLIDIACHLFRMGADEGHHIHLCCYHSRHPLLVRAGIERILDACLDRHDAAAVFRHPDIRIRLNHHAEPDQIFVVLASPVAEVGRDHDYDWAIVEPSSERSIIQLAGRVRRHREGACEMPNITLLATNLTALESPGHPAYCRPGFESKGAWQLESHRLEDILVPEQYQRIDAIPRIIERKPLRHRTNLDDLEHQRLHDVFGHLDEHAETNAGGWNTALWLNTPIHLTGLAQYIQRFRAGSLQARYVLMPDEDMGDTVFTRLECDNTPTQCSNLLKHADLTYGARIEPWAVVDYLPELQRLMEVFDLSAERCARQFGFLDMEPRDQGWQYHHVLGFRRYLS
jgi:CRISPR-associated endonuclease/helicase Cas3